LDGDGATACDADCDDFDPRRAGGFLLRRVFEIDVLKCPTCGGRPRLVSVILDGLSARRSLKGASRVLEPGARPPPPQ